jgi:hypothetical protein
LTDAAQHRLRALATGPLHAPGITATVTLVTYDPRTRSTGDLLRDWAAVMRELRRRNVIRTNNNPVGDIAEAIVHGHFGGERASFSGPGWDVRTPDGERIQVKAIRTTSTTKRKNLSPIRDRDYDSVVVIIFDEEFQLTDALNSRARSPRRPPPSSST